MTDQMTPAPPTLADMTEEERDACQWMQADVAGRDGQWVIADPAFKEGFWRVMSEAGGIRCLPTSSITPRHDLPRLEWPGDKKVEDVTPAKMGTVIESADDPRISALPVGTVLIDCDGDSVAKRGGDWAGLGYIPIESEGTEFGPWTVVRIGQGADQ